MSDWSNIGSDARARSARPGPTCSVKVLLDSLPPADGAELRKALADPTIRATGLHRALRDRTVGEPPSTWSLSAHRRNDCACSR